LNFQVKFVIADESPMSDSRNKRPVVEIIEPELVRVLRQKTPSERLAQAFRIWESAREIIRASVHQQHPDWNEDRILREVARRLSHGATERVPR
jgi:hypothetical protein